MDNPMTSRPSGNTDLIQLGQKLLPDLPLDTLADSLQLVLGLQGASILEVHDHVQQQKLYQWNNLAEPTLSINGVLRGLKADIREGANRCIRHSDVFKPAVVDVGRWERAPDAYIVPLGFHGFNMTRMASLVGTLKAVRERFGNDALANAHLYFLGGRRLLKAEITGSWEDQLSVGFAQYYCTTEWPNLSKEEQQGFCADFLAELEKHLGDVAKFEMKGNTGELFETDSARQLWDALPGLEELRPLLDGRTHFVETPPEEYKKLARDNTHGNALQFLKHPSNEGRKPGEKHLVVCSDPICCPRAGLTFRGYAEREGWQVSASSFPFVENDQPWDGLFLSMHLREAVCILNEVVQFSRDDTWFGAQPRIDRG